MQDIGIKTKDAEFKLRACAVVIRDGKILVARARKFEGYVLPGGHIKLGETSEEAMLREFEEEIGVKGKIEKLLFVNENIFSANDKIYSEVCYYYLMTTLEELPTNNYTREEMDDGVLCIHNYEWIELSEAKSSNLKPQHIADLIIEDTHEKYIFTDER